jgi:hypothetical protein
MLFGIMRRHVIEHHGEVYTTDPVFSLFNCYSNNWWEDFIENVAFDLGVHQVSMSRCLYGRCTSVFTTDSEVKGHCSRYHKFDYKFSPFWKLIKLNVELGNVNVFEGLYDQRRSHI